jgi:hypothetical protein
MWQNNRIQDIKVDTIANNTIAVKELKKDNWQEIGVKNNKKMFGNTKTLVRELIDDNVLESILGQYTLAELNNTIIKLKNNQDEQYISDVYNVDNLDDFIFSQPYSYLNVEHNNGITKVYSLHLE